MRLLPRTGRTHQLRVHFADLGFPLIGDKVYGHKQPSSDRRSGNDLLIESFPRQALHAEKLAIDHVRTGKRMEFHAPLAKDLEALLNSLRQSNADRVERCEELSRQRG